MIDGAVELAVVLGVVDGVDVDGVDELFVVLGVVELYMRLGVIDEVLLVVVQGVVV